MIKFVASHLRDIDLFARFGIEAMVLNWKDEQFQITASFGVTTFEKTHPSSKRERPEFPFNPGCIDIRAPALSPAEKMSFLL